MSDDDDALIAAWLATHRPRRLPPGKARGAGHLARWSVGRSGANALSRAHGSNRLRWRASAKKAEKERQEAHFRAAAAKERKKKRASNGNERNHAGARHGDERGTQTPRRQRRHGLPSGRQRDAQGRSGIAQAIDEAVDKVLLF